MGDVLVSSHTRSDYIFFPLEAVVSLVRPLRNEMSIELGLIGSEGMVGLDVIMDAKTQLDDAIVQSAGAVLRMPAGDLRKLFASGGALHTYLLRFTHAFLGQVSQNAACNQLHPLSARISKRLLMIQDRATMATVYSTPLLLASAFGAKESEIEHAFEQLCATGGLRQRRDAITIDRDRLEMTSCECYDTLRDAYERTLSV
ncbi:MAG TPA: Crp/Fnr family transcriptional regulator [Thermoanaerobaculia bacterium]|nr:Crp/Fnr family transcriptional regulator [Thermoanaerobaculia bacterium]